MGERIKHEVENLYKREGDWKKNCDLRSEGARAKKRLGKKKKNEEKHAKTFFII